MYKLALLFLYFIMYSVGGWVFEMFYCTVLDTIKNKKFTMHNRGFLYGPLCPIYGCVTSVMILGLSNLQDNIALMSLLGVLLCDTVEYFTSYIMEKMFHTRWWDYSDRFLNVHGRIDFNHSVQWAVLSVVFMKIIHPFCKQVFEPFGEEELLKIALVAFLLFSYDLITTIISSISVRDLQKRMERLRASFSTLAEDSPLKRENIPEYAAEFKDRLMRVNSKRRGRHILITFPEIMSLMESEMDEIQAVPHEFMNDIDDIRSDIVNFIDDHRPEMH